MEGEGVPPPLSAFQLPRGRHGIPPEQVVESQRWRLLGATAEALVERGYTGIRIADIATRAGVSRGTFYELFEDLPACLLASYEMVADCIRDLAGSACGGQGEWEARLRTALEGILRFLAEEPALAHLLAAEVSAGVSAIAAARERLIEELASAGAGRHSIDGAFALVSERIAAGQTTRLPELAPQLAELINRGREAGKPPRGGPSK